MDDVSQPRTEGADVAASLHAGRREVAGVFLSPFGVDGVLRVTTLAGRWGEEILIEPFDAHGNASVSAAPEYHLTIPGALRAPIIYRTSTSPVTVKSGWTAENDEDLTTWLAAVPFGADHLPTTYVTGAGSVPIETVLQLHPIDQNLSSLVFTIGGQHQALDLGPYYEVAERLLSAASQSYAPRAMRPVEPPRFADAVYLARQGQLERLDSALAADVHRATPATTASQPQSASTPDAGTHAEPGSVAVARTGVIHPDQVAPAIIARLAPMVGKRILLQDGGTGIPPKLMGNIVKKVARGVDESEIIAFLDTGIRASGKAGVAVTSHEVHICEMNEHRVVRIDEIVALNQLGRKVEITTTRGSEPADLIRVDIFGVDEAVVAALEAATGVTATATLERPGF